MQLKVTENGLQIIPDDDQDRAYIRDTLGLKCHGATVQLVRVDAKQPDAISGEMVLSYVTTAKAKCPTTIVDFDPKRPNRDEE